MEQQTGKTVYQEDQSGSQAVRMLRQRANLFSAFSSMISLIPTALGGSVAAERIRELTQLKKEPRQEKNVSPVAALPMCLRAI